MPFGQVAAFMYQPIGTGGRHPMRVAVDIFGAQHNAACHHLFAQWVIPTGTSFVVEQAAGDCSVANFKGVFVFELQQAAFPAAITQGFPFRFGHVGHIDLAPKRGAQAVSVNVLAHGVVVERITPIV